MSISSVLVCLLVVGAGWHLSKTWTKKLPLPPGPKGFPIIGNVYDIPSRMAWVAYHEWTKKYGPIFSFSVFGKTTIVLNSLQAATDLLDKRSINFSSRPRMVMADELLDWDWDFAHMPYHERWRRHRRMFHQYFQTKNLPAFEPFQKKMTVAFLGHLSDSPSEFISHIRQYVGSVVLNIAYGYEKESENDFYIQSVQRAIEPLLHAIHATGSFLVEFVPALKYVPPWMPGASFKRNVLIDAQKVRDLRDIPFNGVKALMGKGLAPRSFVSDNLPNVKDGNVSEEEELVRNCAAIVYLAGSDSTAALITAFFLAMAHYPQVQRKAQEEIDRVTDGTKLPDHSDVEALPYIRALILETLRWHSIAPLALPHQAVKEDEYNGFRIPAGATVTVNTWAIMHDENIYHEPFTFDPERFLRDGKLNFDTQPDPTFSGGFGFGRRICPGRQVALQSASLLISSVLATYNISKAVSADGVTIEPLIKPTDGVVSHPQPFVANFTPRSDAAIKLMEAARMDIDAF